MVEVDVTRIVFSSTNTIIALGTAAGIVITVLAFVWRSMKNNIITDVNKKIDVSDKELSSRLDKQDSKLEYLTKGHETIYTLLTELKASMFTIGDTATKHILTETAMTSGLKSDIRGHETRLKGIEDNIKMFMDKFLK